MLEVPIELGTADIDLRLILTDDVVNTVRGIVWSEDGRPVRDGFVYVFPTASSLWVDTSSSAPRVRVVRVEADGHFVLNAVPSGEYYVRAARNLVDLWQTVDNLKALSRDAMVVKVPHSGSHRLELRIGRD